MGVEPSTTKQMSIGSGDRLRADAYAHDEGSNASVLDSVMSRLSPYPAYFSQCL